MREAEEDEPWTHATGVINWGDLFWSCRDPVTDAASQPCMHAAHCSVFNWAELCCENLLACRHITSTSNTTLVPVQ
jgi:hypothetical protein